MARTFVMADIHGCLDEFRELLRKIEFCDEDELYILGDVLDRGEEPIALLLDIMEHVNVFLIKGNHEAMAETVLSSLNVEIDEKSIENLSADTITAHLNWMRNGGDVTAKQFSALSAAQREDVLCYLEEADDFEILKISGKTYVLVHAGLSNFRQDREIYEYEIDELIWDRADYGKRYFDDENIVLVTGHTPTPLIREDKESLVFEENGHLAIDCGCVFGGNLAAVCLNTGEVTYVSKKQP